MGILPNHTEADGERDSVVAHIDASSTEGSDLVAASGATRDEPLADDAKEPLDSSASPAILPNHTEADDIRETLEDAVHSENLSNRTDHSKVVAPSEIESVSDEIPGTNVKQAAALPDA